MSTREILLNNISRDIYDRGYEALNCSEKYHVQTEYIGMQEMEQEFFNTCSDG